MVDHVVRPLGVIPCAGEEHEEPGVEVAAAGRHDQAGGRGEPHRRLQAAAVADRGEARADPRSQHDPSFCLRRRSDPGQLLHEEAVRQPVEAVAPDAQPPVPPRDRDDLCGPGQVTVERRVETGDLGKARDGLVIASISAISPGRCSGSRGAIRRSWSSISASTGGSTNRPPPWTMRCPTTAIAPRPSRRSTCSSTRPAAAAWSGAATAILPPAAVRFADDQPMNDRGELFDPVQHLPHSLGERGAGPRGLLAEEVQMHGQQRQALVQVVVQLAGDPSASQIPGPGAAARSGPAARGSLLQPSSARLRFARSTSSPMISSASTMHREMTPTIRHR